MALSWRFFACEVYGTYLEFLIFNEKSEFITFLNKLQLIYICYSILIKSNIAEVRYIQGLKCVLLATNIYAERVPKPDNLID